MVHSHNAALALEEQTVLHKALLRIIDNLALNQHQLGQIIGLSGASMSRFYHGEKSLLPSSTEGQLALLLIRLYRSLDAILGGDVQNCRIWFTSYNHHLNGVPANLVTKIQGLVAVTNYLDVMRGKL